MIYLTKEELNKIKDKEFGILLFYATGCKYCEISKPLFEEASKNFPQIGFYAIEFNEGKEYYEKFAEDVEDVTYQEVKNDKGESEFVAVPNLNEDGSPKIVKKYSFPSFYVHHSKASNPENEYGFIGGWDGATEKDLETVLMLIMGLMNEHTSGQTQAS
jgi:thiol-disulfide isomerase/thioredoxin